MTTTSETGEAGFTAEWFALGQAVNAAERAGRIDAALAAELRTRLGRLDELHSFEVLNAALGLTDEPTLAL